MTIRDHGSIPISPWVGAMLAINAKYSAAGGPTGFLGAESGGISSCPDSIGFYRHYAGGSIYWTPRTGAHEVHGDIRGLWASMGWERSLLGYPTTDETGTPDGVGRYNHFQGGSIYWTPATGAHEVHGEIRNHWASMGWEQGLLGYPTTDETGTPDGVGRYNHFRGGSIYWTPATGAHEVHGEILKKWASLGWEKSFLGYPITDEVSTCDGLRRLSFFQSGSITWSPRMGAQARATPKWDPTIRGCFNDEDIHHMLYGSEQGPVPSPIDLADYAAVRDNAAAILDRVCRSENDPLLMPPLPRVPWSPDLVDLFQEWLVGGMPA